MEIDNSEINDLITDARISKLHLFIVTSLQWKWDVMVFASVRAYLTYKVLAQYDEAIYKDKRNVYSSRYLLNSMNQAAFSGKKICLADDVISSGSKMFEYYCLLKKAGAAKVIPTVYAQSIEYPQKSELDYMQSVYRKIISVNDSSEKVKSIIRNFQGALYCHQYETQKNISELCLLEAEWQQRNLCLKKADMPVIIPKDQKNGESKNQFVLQKRQFEKLCGKNQQWQYVYSIYDRWRSEESDCSIQGELNVQVQASYFECLSQTIEKLYQSVLLTGGVQCKYCETENDRYCVTFAPFVVFRSLEKEDIRKILGILLQGTDYGESFLAILRESDSQKNDKLWKEAMHQLNYIISMHIGSLFIEYFSKSTGMEVQFGWESVENEMDFSKITEEKLVQLSDFTVWHSGYRKNGKKKYSLSSAFSDIYSILIKFPNNLTAIEIEQIEERLLSKYYFCNQAEARQATARILLLMQEIGVLEEYIDVSVSSVKGRYRQGEYYGLFLTKTAKLCYFLSEILYFAVGKDEFFDYIKDFFEKMLKYMEDENLVAPYLLRSEYLENADWFSRIEKDKLHEKIMGGQFLRRNMDSVAKQVCEKAKIIADEIRTGGVTRCRMNMSNLNIL